jgi:hypothetical protein
MHHGRFVWKFRTDAEDVCLGCIIITTTSEEV